MSDANHQPDPPEEERSLAERALDLFVFAPAGALLSTWEDFPEMASKGRARVEQELRNAHVVGRFTVGYGQRVVKQQLEHLVGEVSRATGRPPSAPEPPEPARSPRPAERHRATGSVASSEPGPVPGAPGTAGAAPVARPDPSADVTSETAAWRDGPTDLAIPDYDTLSASQVVRRLDGLGPEELRAVVHHESATRARRTILHRAQQLLATARPTSPPSDSD